MDNSKSALRYELQVNADFKGVKEPIDLNKSECKRAAFVYINLDLN